MAGDAPPLPGAEDRTTGRQRPNGRMVPNGIIFVPRSAAPWRDMPERGSPYTTVFNRSHRPLAQEGPRGRIVEALAAGLTQSPHLIDSAIVHAHLPSASGKGSGSSRRSLS